MKNQRNNNKKSRRSQQRFQARQRKAKEEKIYTAAKQQKDLINQEIQSSKWIKQKIARIYGLAVDPLLTKNNNAGSFENNNSQGRR